MRVAAIYDIHANLPALEAVLFDIRQSDVDHIVVGGDVVLGPMPLETLQLLLGLDIPVQFVRGNCDRDVLSVMADGDGASVPGRVREIVRWVGRQLYPEHERVMAGWPTSLRIDVPRVGRVLFCHATPRSDNEIFTRLTDVERLLPAFENVQADVVVCGHTHMQFERTVGTTQVVNAGSVGMPFGEPGADWLILGPSVQLRHTSYDTADAAERIRGTQYPDAADFARGHVLNPPAEATMLETFRGVELK